MAPSYEGSSGNEADSEGKSYGKEVKKIKQMINCFDPYMFETEKNVSSTSFSSANESEETEIEDETVERRVGNLYWCTCGGCKKERQVIDCL